MWIWLREKKRAMLWLAMSLWFSASLINRDIGQKIRKITELFYQIFVDLYWWLLDGRRLVCGVKKRPKKRGTTRYELAAMNIRTLANYDRSLGPNYKNHAPQNIKPYTIDRMPMTPTLTPPPPIPTPTLRLLLLLLQLVLRSRESGSVGLQAEPGLVPRRRGLSGSRPPRSRGRTALGPCPGIITKEGQQERVH